MKKGLPYLLAVLLFLILTLIQFQPLISGKALRQYDISQHRGASREISDFREKYHEEPLWTNSMFGGMPAYQISVLYPGNWVVYIDKAMHLFLPAQAGYMFMYFLGFFILLLCLRVNPWLALVGSLAYGFSSYFYIIIEVGHNSKAAAIGYLAPTLGGLLLLLQRRYLAGFAVTALFLALELNANHLQITYYGFILFAFVFAGYFLKDLRIKQLKEYFKGVAVFAAAVLLAILPNIAGLWCTYEYGRYTTRGPGELTIDAQGKPKASNATSGLDKAYALDYSYGPGETFTFLIPNFKGGASTARISEHKGVLDKVDPSLREITGQFGSYFGPQEYTAGPVYIGAIVFFLAFFGMFIIRHPLKWPLFMATLLTVMLSWGKFFPGLSNFFLDYFPAYNKFRAVSILTVVAELTIPLLAVLALDHLITQPHGEEGLTISGKRFNKKQLLMASLIVTGGFCLLCIALPNVFNTFTSGQEEQRIFSQFKQSGYPDEVVNPLMPGLMNSLTVARSAIFTADVTRSLVFIVLATAILLLFLLKKINLYVMLPAIGILLVSDLWPVVARSLRQENFRPVNEVMTQQPTKADEVILQDTSLNYRVLNIAVSPFQDATTSWFHKSVGGYHGAKLKKYHELMEFHLFREINTIQMGLSAVYGNDSAMKMLFMGTPVLNMLNTRYIIVPTRQEPMTVRNPEAFGNAWFVKEMRSVANANEEIMGLRELTGRDRCIIRQRNKTEYSLKDNYSGEGTVRLETANPRHLVYQSNSSSAQFAVFSEIWYPKGWNAFIDGAKAEYTCVNYLLRGMEIPAGNHTVDFRFEPVSYAIGNRIAYAGSMLLVLSLAGTMVVIIRKKKQGQNDMKG